MRAKRGLRQTSRSAMKVMAPAGSTPNTAMVFDAWLPTTSRRRSFDRLKCRGWAPRELSCSISVSAPVRGVDHVRDQRTHRDVVEAHRHEQQVAGGRDVDLGAVLDAGVTGGQRDVGRRDERHRAGGLVDAEQIDRARRRRGAPGGLVDRIQPRPARVQGDVARPGHGGGSVTVLDGVSAPVAALKP